MGEFELIDIKRFENPGDQENRVAEGGWKTYEPENPRTPEETGRIHTASIRLLTAESEIEKRTSAESLVAFAKLAEVSAQKTLNRSINKSNGKRAVHLHA